MNHSIISIIIFIIYTNTKCKFRSLLVNNSLLNPYLFWEEDYISLEEEFMEILRYIPLSEEHEGVWSLKLANLLLLIGSSIESF